MSSRALVVGVTGISGGNRRAAPAGRRLGGRRSVSAPGRPRRAGHADERPTSLDPEAVARGRARIRPDARLLHDLAATRDRGREHRRQRSHAAEPARRDRAPRSPCEHVALVTGLKHYLGPFEAYAKAQPDTPFSEDQARLPYENFYYVQEDILFAAAERDGFAWSVHRPHTLIGWALGNAMNMGVTLAVYAAICRETGRGFHFPGSREQWEAVTDVTDARLLADHLVWASTTPAAANRALNIVNGDVFRWRRLWPRLAAALEVEPVPFDGTPAPLEQQMAGAGRDLARDRAPPRPARPRRGHASPRGGTPTPTSGARSRRSRTWGTAGGSASSGVRDSESSFTELFARLRAERIVP